MHYYAVREEFECAAVDKLTPSFVTSSELAGFHFLPLLLIYPIHSSQAVFQLVKLVLFIYNDIVSPYHLYRTAVFLSIHRRSGL